ncbi:hypothetical protein CPB83DRAFT_862073 [Crepidotus variabilis]|uniref:Uncharacterized protein n=1 Tax=Crepidotus variabilis TaxID=179855 RepID=A0A9P6E7G4_9AGAR|nr:hypothetical protein CPB83DRAFT_862073 [Crepidotus variabilis]
MSKSSKLARPGLSPSTSPLPAHLVAVARLFSAPPALVVLAKATSIPSRRPSLSLKPQATAMSACTRRTIKLEAWLKG